MAKMDSSEFEAIVASEIEQAIDFIDDEISPFRALATDFYHGRPFGNEDEDTNRSKMVSTDVRDTVNAMIPSLIKVFTGSDKVVEYVPTGAEDVKNAEQATDYANYVLFKLNDGFTVFDECFKDSLIRKCGIIKAWWDDAKKVKIENFTGLDDNTVMVLQNEPDTEVKIKDTSYIEAQDVDPLTGMPIAIMVPIYDVEVKKTLDKGQPRIECLPPEEFIIDRRATSLDNASIVGHRRMMTLSDLVEMGYKQSEVEQYLTDEDFEDNEEYITRTNYVQYDVNATNNRAMKRAQYVEAYIRIDRDGDGIAELLKICTLGSGHKVFKFEPVDHIPFALFPFDPEPHLSPIQANSLADRLMDIQLLKSEVWRQSLDGLAQAIVPRTAVVEGQANIDDVLNKDVGAIIRLKQAGAVQDLVTPDVSPSGLNMIAYVDQVKERRTGIGDMTMGLDADALNSSTRIGANAMVSAGQQRLELAARYMANGMRDLFKVILHIITTHQDKPAMIRLRNEWVEIDPRYWNSEMDVNINVGLGSGSDEQKLMMLMQIKQSQETILTTLGPSNPLVSLPQYSNTLSKIAQLAGFKDSSQYFTQLPAEFQLPEPPPPSDDPAKLLAQVETEKIQAKFAVDSAKLQMEQQKAMFEVEKQKYEISLKERDLQFKERELELKAQEIENKRQLDEAKLLLEQVKGMKDEKSVQEEAYKNGQESVLNMINDNQGDQS